MKELENQNFNLEIDKRARDQIVGHAARTDDSTDHKFLLQQLSQTSRRVGQLETEMRQLTAPSRDRRPTRDDKTGIDDDAIEAEYRDPHESAGPEHDDVSTNA